MIWWLSQLDRQLSHSVVMVTLICARGSTPQVPGARLLVSADDCIGTIGGGRLEWLATERARDCLSGAESRKRFVETTALGSQLRQCCGGSMTLLFEHFTPADKHWVSALLRARHSGQLLRLDLATPESQRKLVPATNDAVFTGEASACLSADAAELLYERVDDPRTPVYLFGAGHVGQALAGQLAKLPFAVTWIDSRAAEWVSQPPASVCTLFSAAPVREAERAAAGAMFLILTHDHGEDFNILHSLLERGDTGWIGLIGSASKWAVFRRHLRAEGISDEQLARVSCPIGIPGISSKQPAVIAASVVAQLLQLREQLELPASEPAAQQRKGEHHVCA
jgi:xanthine dehydrogenase accessory factor